MRKTIIIIGLFFVFVISSASLCLAAKDMKGASQKARENASENAIFNRVGDWFATVGKSDVEKEQIIAKRKAERVAKRAEKEAKKEAKRAEKELKKGKKEAEDAGKKAKDKMKKMKASNMK